MPAFLATYRPIISTAHGQAAAQTFGIPPFVDSSCRREPCRSNGPANHDRGTASATPLMPLVS